MGLVAYALRTALQQMLKGKTAAGDHVLDSEIEPVDTVTKGLQQPLIAIYCADTEMEPVGMGLMGRGSTATITIQIYAPSEIVITGAEDQEVRFENGAIALALDIMQYQILDEIVSSVEPWAEFFRKVALSASKVTTNAVLLQIEGGVTIPCREISVEVKTLAQPAPGRPLTGVWATFDTLLREGGDEMVALADVLKTVIETPADLADWRKMQALLGATVSGMYTIGLAPVFQTTSEPAPLADEIEVDGELDTSQPHLLPGETP